MQEFRPECTINLHLESSGKPARQAWFCALLDERGARILIAAKFLGAVSRDESALRALHFGLVQALRLRTEKVELVGEIPLSFLGEERAGVGRLGELQSLKEECVEAWNRFRLRRVRSHRPEERELMRRATDAFFRNKPGGGGQ